MLRRILKVLLILFFCWTGQAFAAEISGLVKKVIDGDSLVVATGEGVLEIRLYGVDCPEYGQAFFQEAKSFTRKNVLGKRVTIAPMAEDAYGRTVALVARGEHVLNSDLVAAGLAWVYPRYCKRDFCDGWKNSERSARDGKKGLWLDTRPDPPWQWKRSRKGR